MRRLIALLMLFFCTTSAHAFIQPDERFPDPAQEARAEALGQMILCPVCDGQAINGSDSAVAVAMRTTLRAQIRAGNSDAQILAWFRERYGENIISHPSLTPATGILWLMPVLVLTIGGVLVFRCLPLAK